MKTPAGTLELINICRSYRIGPVTTDILKGIHLAVGAGDLVSIMGPSGSGKTTLMNIIGLLDRPTSGTCSLNGRDVSKLKDDERSRLRNTHIGFVFQSFQLLPQLTALENVRLPLVYRGAGRSQTNRRGPVYIRSDRALPQVLYIRPGIGFPQGGCPGPPDPVLAAIAESGTGNSGLQGFAPLPLEWQTGQAEGSMAGPV